MPYEGVVPIPILVAEGKSKSPSASMVIAAGVVTDRMVRPSGVVMPPASLIITERS